MFRAASAVVVILTFVHLLFLPLVVSYDGMEYAHLATILFTPSFDAQWNFVRTPLFPFSLKCAFAFGGEQPQAALLVTTGFGLAGVLLLGAIVRKVAGETIAAIVLLVTAFYPILTGYEHMLLSETGIFFWLSLLIWSLLATTNYKFALDRPDPSRWLLLAPHHPLSNPHRRPSLFPTEPRP